MRRTCGSRCCTKSRPGAWTPTRTTSTIPRSRIGTASASVQGAHRRPRSRAPRSPARCGVFAPTASEILPPRTLDYDTLIVCIGSVSNDFGVPGVAQHAISLDTPDDAERFHRRLIAACVRADARAAAGEPAQVHIVIIGAGATGVELAAEIRQTTRAHAGYGLEHLDPARDIRLTLLEAAPRILPPAHRATVGGSGRIAADGSTSTCAPAARDRCRRRRRAHGKPANSSGPISSSGPQASWRRRSCARSTASR